MAATGLAFFATSIGHCAVAWGERGICAMQLPELSESELRARMQRRHAGAAELPPPSDVQAAIDQVRALLDGAEVDLSRIPLDMDGVPAFHRRVFEITRAIPRGQVLTYGEVAARLDDPGAARAVGQALGANPFAPIVPCHRVVAAGTKLGGFSARGGVTTKLRMLGIEGARITEAQTPDLFD